MLYYFSKFLNTADESVCLHDQYQTLVYFQLATQLVNLACDVWEYILEYRKDIAQIADKALDNLDDLQLMAEGAVGKAKEAASDAKNKIAQATDKVSDIVKRKKKTPASPQDSNAPSAAAPSVDDKTN
jgi:phage gp36-like protein